MQDNILVIDTSSNILLLALAFNGQLFEVQKERSKRFSIVILEEVDNLLKTAKANLKSIDYIAVGVGPGSFTGIRIGVATANALSKALGINLVTFTSLEPMLVKSGKNIALIDCKNNNYYSYNAKEQVFGCSKIDDITSFINNHNATTQRANLKMILNLVNQKIKNNEFVSNAVPFYIKKSSAVKRSNI